VSPAEPNARFEVVVAADGSIPADQLAPLGIRPGSHLRIIDAAPGEDTDGLAASLPGLPDLSWEDFERGSLLAVRDLNPS